MKEIFVQFPTFEVAQALDQDLSQKLGGVFSSKKMQQRIVAILFALKDLGSVTSSDRGCETWFYIDPNENWADDVLQIRLIRAGEINAVPVALGERSR